AVPVAGADAATAGVVWWRTRKTVLVAAVTTTAAATVHSRAFGFTCRPTDRAGMPRPPRPAGHGRPPAPREPTVCPCSPPAVGPPIATGSRGPGHTRCS